jgi:hypothetical protein
MKSLTELEAEDATLVWPTGMEMANGILRDTYRKSWISAQKALMREVEPLLTQRKEMLAFIDRVCRLENEDLKSYYLMDGLRDDAGILKAKLEGK